MWYFLTEDWSIDISERNRHGKALIQWDVISAQHFQSNIQTCSKHWPAPNQLPPFAVSEIAFMVHKKQKRIMEAPVRKAWILSRVFISWGFVCLFAIFYLVWKSVIPVFQCGRGTWLDWGRFFPYFPPNCCAYGSVNLFSSRCEKLLPHRCVLSGLWNTLTVVLWSALSYDALLHKMH